MGFSLGSLINPRLGLSIVKNQIEKHIKALDSELKYFDTDKDHFNANRFDLIFNATEKKIDFRVMFNNKVKKYFFNESEKLCEIIAKMVKEKMNEATTIDFTVITVDKDKDILFADVYYTDANGEKLKNKIDL